MYPDGIRGSINWVSRRYNHPVIYIFENGVSVPGETELPLSQALHDTFRVDFYKGYINAVIKSVTEDGADVRGYFAWALMDNFEWADGYSTRFGLTYVDYRNDQKRYIKDSFLWYSVFISSGSTEPHNVTLTESVLRDLPRDVT